MQEKVVVYASVKTLTEEKTESAKATEGTQAEIARVTEALTQAHLQAQEWEEKCVGLQSAKETADAIISDQVISDQDTREYSADVIHNNPKTRRDN